MKVLKYIIFLIALSVSSQESVSAIFINKTDLINKTIADIDNFGSLYTIDDVVLSKKSPDKNTITYSNVQLSDISSANAFNPLQIHVFYKNFNTAVILDNRLSEVFRIDFNSIQPYRNVAFISTGHDNTLWLLNQDTKQLELYDYKRNATRVTTLPVQGQIIDMTSNYNYCYLLTEKHVLIYNYFGSLITKIDNNGFTSLSESNENVVLKKENALFFLKKDSKNIVPIALPNLLISAFFVTNETLYIYASEILHHFQLKID
ncbi:hypothetical protein ACFFU9_09320 [Mariniflexile ostreae]|uniref:6-bladed beta-propeller protein n=1 Tax=Mariniflexile ostreae TaxID=1520892 RepID=A0ABV5FBX2_9FLAO